MILSFNTTNMNHKMVGVVWLFVGEVVVVVVIFCFVAVSFSSLLCCDRELISRPVFDTMMSRILEIIEQI